MKIDDAEDAIFFFNSELNNHEDYIDWSIGCQYLSNVKESELFTVEFRKSELINAFTDARGKGFPDNFLLQMAKAHSAARSAVMEEHNEIKADHDERFLAKVDEDCFSFWSEYMLPWEEVERAIAVYV
ncbi:MAG: hypothetical protein KAS32_08395, partial [Candidatus Peribacteraceae bacterium]|nr:hypothetical protein [Candidatus Peribacteraceae bacterium]